MCSHDWRYIETISMVAGRALAYHRIKNHSSRKHLYFSNIFTQKTISPWCPLTVCNYMTISAYSHRNPKARTQGKHAFLKSLDLKKDWDMSGQFLQFHYSAKSTFFAVLELNDKDYFHEIFQVLFWIDEIFEVFRGWFTTEKPLSFQF